MNRPGLVKKFLGMQESGVLILTVLFCVIASVFNSAFISTGNVINLLRSTGFTLITTVGMTFVLITGGLDLSVGSVLALGGAVCSIALQSGLPIPVSILLGVVAGAAIGILNGFIIVKIGIPPLMVTLGTQYIARGIVYVMTKGVPVYPLPKEFQAIEQNNWIGPIPNIVIISLVIAAIGFVVLRWTVFGREVYAVGGNTESARISGINVNRVKYVVYIVTGALAGLTGVLMAARLASGQASVGTSYELTVIASSVIGGTSTFGGIGTIAGSALGAMFMEIMGNALTLMKIDVYWQNVTIGAILIIAVIMDQYRRNILLRSGSIRKSGGA